MVVEKVFADGKLLRYGEVLAAEYDGAATGRKRLFRYADPTGQTSYFDDDGQSARRGFLKSPLKYANITSRFGNRRHPVLGYTRAHEGVDYGAPTGTPVWAVGDGQVKSAGWNGGCGKAVILRHRNGYETVYCHLSGHRGLRREAGLAEADHRLRRRDRPRDRAAPPLRGEARRRVREPAPAQGPARAPRSRRSGWTTSARRSRRSARGSRARSRALSGRCTPRASAAELAPARQRRRRRARSAVSVFPFQSLPCSAGDGPVERLRRDLEEAVAPAQLDRRGPRRRARAPPPPRAPRPRRPRPSRRARGRSGARARTLSGLAVLAVRAAAPAPATASARLADRHLARLALPPEADAPRPPRGAGAPRARSRSRSLAVARRGAPLPRRRSRARRRGRGRARVPAALALAAPPLRAGRLPLLALVLDALVLGLLHVRHLLDAVVREEVLEREGDEPVAVLPRLELLRERDERLEDRGAHRLLQLGDVPLGPDARAPPPASAASSPRTRSRTSSGAP